MTKQIALKILLAAALALLSACGGGGGGSTSASQKTPQYVKSFNTGTNDAFGSTVAISGDGNTMAIGAYAESSATTTINGDMSDDSAPAAGAVYIYARDTATGLWQQQAYLKASNAEIDDAFGAALGISDDGNTVAVGAWREESNAVDGPGDNSAKWSGAVYVFTRTGSQWIQQAYLKASNATAYDCFGQYIALSGDGNTLAAGAIGEDSTATGINGNQTSDNTSPGGYGAVYVFTRATNSWSQQAYIKSSNTSSADYFGSSVSLSNDGGTLAVGVLYEDSNATGINGNGANNDATDSGAVYVFTRSSGVWSQQAYVKASNTEAGDLFGKAVSLSGDGKTLAVGAIGEASNATGVNESENDNSSVSGAVYVFTQSSGSWSQQAYVKSSNTGTGDEFGTVVRLSYNGNTLAVGAPYEMSNATGLNGDQANNSLTHAGAAYVFTRSGGTWSQKSYVKALNTDANDFFGFALSLTSDGNTLAVGAYNESSAATGIGGDQADNSATNAGAVYVY